MNQIPWDLESLLYAFVCKTGQFDTFLLCNNINVILPPECRAEYLTKYWFLMPFKGPMLKYRRKGDIVERGNTKTTHGIRLDAGVNRWKQRGAYCWTGNLAPVSSPFVSFPTPSCTAAVLFIPNTSFFRTGNFRCLEKPVVY